MIATAVVHAATDPGTSGSSWPALVGAVVLGWVLLQACTLKRQEKWGRRFAALAPICRYFVADAVAVYRTVNAHFVYRRAKKSIDWDDTEIL